MPDLRGKVALVTGGTEGIGEEVAAVLYRAGAAVVLFARNGKAAERKALEIDAAAGRGAGFACDVTDPGAVAAAVQRTVDRFGALHLAGVTGPGRGRGDGARGLGRGDRHERHRDVSLPEARDPGDDGSRRRRDRRPVGGERRGGGPRSLHRDEARDRRALPGRRRWRWLRRGSASTPWVRATWGRRGCGRRRRRCSPICARRIRWGGWQRGGSRRPRRLPPVGRGKLLHGRVLPDRRRLHRPVTKKPGRRASGLRRFRGRPQGPVSGDQLSSSESATKRGSS